MATSAKDLYLDLIKRCILDGIYPESDQELACRIAGKGGSWPKVAHTMIGLERLNNIQMCIETVIKDGIDGDILEAGVWRGGATIFMKAVLEALGINDRKVWVADSFEGLPAPNIIKYPKDRGLNLHTFPILSVSLDQVKRNFERYGLLDETIQFIKGWFKDSLSNAPIKKLAVLRADGDMYESTTDILTNLYPKVAVGGFVLVDDYGDIAACRQAVDDYRINHGIDDPIIKVDWTGIYWRRLK